MVLGALYLFSICSPPLCPDPFHALRSGQPSAAVPLVIAACTPLQIFGTVILLVFVLMVHFRQALRILKKRIGNDPVYPVVLFLVLLTEDDDQIAIAVVVLLQGCAFAVEDLTGSCDPIFSLVIRNAAQPIGAAHAQSRFRYFLHLL